MALDLSIFDDDKMVFDAGPHTYHYDGQPYRSVSSVVEQFIPAFDREGQSLKSAATKGITQEEILEQWDKTRDDACDLGNALHLCIENFYNGTPIEFVNEEVEFRFVKWLELYKEKLQKLVPVRQELLIFSHRWRIAGTVDMLFAHKDYLMVADWKSNKKLDDYGFDQCPPPFSNEYGSKLFRYTLQLALYEMILNDAGIKTKYSFIVHVPPKTKPAVIIRAYEKMPQYKETLVKALDFEMDSLTSSVMYL